MRTCNVGRCHYTMWVSRIEVELTGRGSQRLYLEIQTWMPVSFSADPIVVLP